MKKLIELIGIVGIIFLTFALPATAGYNFEGFPLSTIRHETFNGGIFVDGGHGLADTSPAKPYSYSQDFAVPSGTLKFAKLYVGVWGGTATNTGNLSTTFNGNNLGSLSLQGSSDTNPNVYAFGYGAYWVHYNVTDKVTPGSTNTAATITNGDIDGRIYGIVLVAAYEDPAKPQIEYWINEGAERLADPKNTANTSFEGAIDKNSSADIWVSYLTGDSGQVDELYMNGNLIATDAADASKGKNFDVDKWSVSGLLVPSGNNVEFKRGGETSVAPVLSVLVLNKGAPTGQPDLTVESITLPPFVYNGTISTINAKISNKGTGNAASFNATLYVDDVPTNAKQVSSLGPGSNTTMSFQWNTPGVGTYTLKVKADTDNTISESDETNNENSTTANVVAKNGYFGDKPLTIYRHEKAKGDVVYTIGNSTYSGELATDGVYAVEANITIPGGSSIKLSRLYTYWSWSHSGSIGVNPEMEVKFDGSIITPEKTYTDSKGFGTYDYPSGTYAYNVTGIVTSSKNYTTVVRNTGAGKNFAMYGVGLLIVFEDASGQEIEYWIGEGSDIISSTASNGVTPEQATSWVNFDGAVDVSAMKNATLLTVAPGADKGDQNKNELIFNTKSWTGALDAPSTSQQIAIDNREVGSYVQSSNNKVGIRDNGDYMVPSNAILILKNQKQSPGLGSADITAGKLTEIGLRTTMDNLYGAASGSLFFGIYDKFDQVVGKRDAPNIVIYGMNSTADPSNWDWSKIKTTGVELNLNLTDPMTHESQIYTTTVSYYDANGNGPKDANEERVYRTTTHLDGSFALETEAGSYDIYASY
jgi:hypothetical protein